MQGRVALLQFVPITLKASKPNETDFEPQTLGEHVRKRRLELTLTQKQAAERLGVNPWTVLNWEKDHTEPPIESMPAIIRFLDYVPFPEPKNIPERLLAKRRAIPHRVGHQSPGLDELTGRIGGRQPIAGHQVKDRLLIHLGETVYPDEKRVDMLSDCQFECAA